MNPTTASGTHGIWSNLSAWNSSVNESIKSGAGGGPFPRVLEPAAVRVVRLAIQTFLFVAGLLGNVLVCIVTSRKRNQKIVGNRFILHLAIADLGIILICFPLVVIRTEYPFSWPFGDVICRTAFPFSDIVYGVEIGCITAIAMHRYRMLVHCMKPQMSVKTANRVIWFIWTCSFVVIVVPLFFVMKLTTMRGAHTVECYPQWPKPISEQLYVVETVILLYVIPLAVILVTYLRIRTKLKESIKMHNSYRLASLRRRRTNGLERENEILKRIAQNERAMKLLTPVVVVFAITMFPVNLYRLLAPFIPSIRSYEHMPVIFRFFLVLLLGNSSVNPLVYSVVNTEFRLEFIRLLRCSRCRGSGRLKFPTTLGGSRSIRRSSSSRRSTSSQFLRKWSSSRSTPPDSAPQTSNWPWKKGSSSALTAGNAADSNRKRKHGQETVDLVVL